MIPVDFIYLAALLNIMGAASYIWGTLQGRTKPNRMTWFLWTVFPLVGAAAQIKGGVGLPTLTIIIAGLDSLIVFICSFVNKKAYWKTTSWDFICGALALTGLVLWYLKRDQDYAIAFSILADFLASLPTLLKAWTKPRTESSWSYFLWFAGHLIGILCVRKPGFTGYAFPAYLILLNLGLFLTVIRPAGKRKRVMA